MKTIQSTHNTNSTRLPKTGSDLFGSAVGSTVGSTVRLAQAIVLILAVFMTLPLQAQAAENSNLGDRNDPRNTQRSVIDDNGINNLTSQRISRRQASNIASSRYEGRVLSILMDNNTNNWRVRMDRDGTVFNVFVNAASGDVKASSD